MMKITGFSTIGKKFGNHVYEDRQIALRDLQNHFYTRKGERLGNPEFGCILPSLVFEPLTEFVIDLVEDEVRFIINEDIRWELLNLDVTIGEHSIVCRVDLMYLPTTTTDQLLLKFTTE